MSDNHDLLNDNDMCSFSGHEAEEMCFNCGDHTCGKRLPFKQESPSLSGFQGFSCEYVPVFLAGKNVNGKQKFKRGAKIC